MKKASMKKLLVPRTRRAHRQEARKEVRKDVEDGVSCPDCREPMTQALTDTTLTYALKWECRCSPGIHYCE